MKDPIFKANKSLQSYFKTSDGNAFFTAHDAKNHASSLKDKKVQEVFNDVKIEAKKDAADDTPIDMDSSTIDDASYEDLVLYAKQNNINTAGRKKQDYKDAIMASFNVAPSADDNAPDVKDQGAENKEENQTPSDATNAENAGETPINEGLN